MWMRTTMTRTTNVAVVTIATRNLHRLLFGLPRQGVKAKQWRRMPSLPVSVIIYFVIFGLLTEILFIVKFMILFCNQVGVITHRTHSVELRTTLNSVKTTIHCIIGLYAIPEEKRTGLVTHFYKDLVRRCFALETKEDWMALKAEWVNQVAKRGVDCPHGQRHSSPARGMDGQDQ
jgi:hypothetical protein